MLAASFWEFISNPATLSITLGLMIPIVATIGAFWQAVEKTKSNNALKQSMIERGYSAAEIERVLAAGKDPDDDDE